LFAPKHWTTSTVLVYLKTRPQYFLWSYIIHDTSSGLSHIFVDMIMLEQNRENLLQVARVKGML
jgi:hypothetical protein